MNEDMRVKPEEAMNKLEGERLETYQKLEDNLNVKQCKIARMSTKGLLKTKKLSISRLYKNSKDKEGQEKYNCWLEEVKKLELEVIRWGLVIDKKKEDEERKLKKA